MSLKEKIRQDELFLYEILKNPVLCSEFIENYDKTDFDEPFKLTDYQVDFLCDFNSHVSIVCARAVGKTEALSDLIIWILINTVFSDYIVYTVPNKSHLDPVFTKLTIKLRTNTLLKNFIEPTKGINNSDHIIKLLNQNTLICRIAGQSGDGRNVVGLHTPFVILDEGGYYPWGTWLELQPVLNTFTDGYRLITSGVPTGLRENNILWHTDQENSSYTKHRISAYQNPRFSDSDRQRALEQYGGEESDDYIHLVLGLHGKPVFSLFDRALMSLQQYPVYKLNLDGVKLGNSITDYITKINTFPSLSDPSRRVIMGIDLGYTEPTAIVIMYIDDKGRFKFHGRIKMNKVSYPIQEKLIDLLDTRFKPAIIGIDEGSAGKSVSQTLIEHDDYLHKNYKKRLIPINFSSQVSIGFDSDGQEIKERTKPLSVGILQEYSNIHKIIYSTTDLEMISELERMTYSKTPTGDIVYRTLTERGGKKGEDHFTAALLCFVLAYYLTDELLNFKRRGKLLTPRWLVG